MQDGELMLQQKNLRGAPSRIPARETHCGQHTGGKEEDETQTHKRRSWRIGQPCRNPTTSMDGLPGTFKAGGVVEADG